MEERLNSELTNKIAEGLRIAIERMIVYKYRNQQSVVISTEEGIRIISGEDLLKYLPIEPKVGSIQLNEG